MKGCGLEDSTTLSAHDCLVWDRLQKKVEHIRLHNYIIMLLTLGLEQTLIYINPLLPKSNL